MNIYYIYCILVCNICIHIIIPIHCILNTYYYPALMKNQAMTGCKRI